MNVGTYCYIAVVEKKTNSRSKNKDYRSEIIITYMEGVSERVHQVLNKYHPQARAGTSKGQGRAVVSSILERQGDC